MTERVSRRVEWDEFTTQRAGLTSDCRYYRRVDPGNGVRFMLPCWVSNEIKHPRAKEHQERLKEQCPLDLRAPPGFTYETLRNFNVLGWHEDARHWNATPASARRQFNGQRKRVTFALARGNEALPGGKNNHTSVPEAIDQARPDVAGSARWKGLFPLAVPTGACRRVLPRSHRARARYHARLDREHAQARLINALNTLFTGCSIARANSSRRTRRRRRRRPSGLKHLVLERTAKLVANFVRGVETPSVELDPGVLQNSYHGSNRNYVELTGANARFPAPGAAKVPLLELLPDYVAAELLTYGVALTGPLEKETRRDTALGVAVGEYAAVIDKGIRSGVIELSREPPRVTNGLFGVTKDTGARVILNARPANRATVAPSDPGLPPIEILGRLGVEAGERLYAGVLDLSDYYHGMTIPEDWRPLFGLPRLRLGATLFYPRWRTLPMGWNQSVTLAQSAHIAQLERASESYRRALRLRGAVRPMLIRRGEVASDPYIDDLVVLATDPRMANHALDNMGAAERCAINDAKTHRAQAGVATRIWGIELDADGNFRPPADKLRELVALTRGLLAATTVATKFLERLVGKWTWYALLRRPVLSIFSALYRQIRCGRPWLTLWPSSRRSLALLCDLAPALVVTPDRPAGALIASDASDTGGAALVDARRSSAQYWRLAPFTYYKGRADLASSAYHTTLNRAFGDARFTAAFGWRWRAPADASIVIKEALALEAGYARALHMRGDARPDHRHAALVDNQGVVCCVARGRSRNARVNGVIRRMAAAELATGATLDVIWVPTSSQPADALSRRF